ncbi:unnamed protein product [Darwinula stevensoni]|uniref:Strumpellin n=1 Tax=Darwinula stevensoni TaxID=69355 RepID=A0A7R9FNY6_9CRUS|nr:unnamed protein product [Darwinula stevensoni]CAG0896952.1 unnamed protein product [Darwinula stevensoni]
MDFLADNNLCGQELLGLVSRGNAIIAELQRLSDNIPSVFKANSKADTSRYAKLMVDFSYFQTLEVFNKEIEENADLQDLDDELRENSMRILSRFYGAFESVHKFVSDLKQFLSHLEEGIYIQQTMESVFSNDIGKQLMCESLFLYGMMLIIVDAKFEGETRERMLVAYYRYSGIRSFGESNIDDVCKLLRSTGYSYSSLQKRPLKYPEVYFSRVPIDETFVNMVIGRLRSDDLYNQISAYPSPEHRSTALATQASMLYVCLYFAPNILCNQTAKMREIVDKYFADNWVITIYMGMVVNLIDAWEPYKAARAALANNLEWSAIKDSASQHGQRMQKLIAETSDWLKEGALNENTVLDHMNRILNRMRDCNVSLRWLMLHTATTTPSAESNKKCRQVRDLLLNESKCSSVLLLKFLLNAAEFELKVRDIYKFLLQEKESKWKTYKTECTERMTELSEVFAGTKPLSRIEKNEKLQAWCADISKEIGLLDSSDIPAVGRKIVNIIQALEEVQEFHQLESNLHVKQCLEETGKFLRYLLRLVNVNEKTLTIIQIVGDVSYAWEIVDSVTPQMQQEITKDPGIVSKLRAVFLKLSSALDLPLLRIHQAKSPDLVSVSDYYSRELVAYVRKVLQIVPESMFTVLDKIVKLLTHQLKDIPTRLEKDKLKEYAQFDERFELAKLTHSVSVFGEGILKMKTTLVGIIELDPKQLLEDGIRKELVRQLSTILDNGLIFSPRAKQSELESRLNHVGKKMEGFRKAFEYIQDYLNICGLKIWQEEMTRIMNYNVERECNSFLRNKVEDWESLYQSKAIPIPKFPPKDADSITFVGRLAREVLRITDPKKTCYIEKMWSWYDHRSHNEVVNARIFSLVESSIGTCGLYGLDRIFSFMLVTELQGCIDAIRASAMYKDKGAVESLSHLQGSVSRPADFAAHTLKLVQQAQSRHGKYLASLVDSLMRIGQMQLLRRRIGHELNSSCKFDSKHLASSLDAFNRALLAAIQDHYRDPTKAYPGEDNAILYELNAYLEYAGMCDPLRKIYVTTNPLDHLSALLFLLLHSVFPRFALTRSLPVLVPKKLQDGIDGLPVVVGIFTLCKQFHSAVAKEFLLLLACFVRSQIEVAIGANRMAEIPPDVRVAVHSFQQFCGFAGLSAKEIDLQLPSIVFSESWNSTPK